MFKLLTRDGFRNAVFARDKNICVACKENPAVDAHHIIDRCLWDNGGYYIENGVSLCSACHFKAEQTILTCEELREKAGILDVVIPEHFNTDEKYDHWGNILLPSGARIAGELYNNENVQKVIPESLRSSFLPYKKYPRTYHVPYSENLQNDDKMHENVNFFTGKEVVVSIKLDGENCSCYSDYIHARSIDSKHHESRNWIKSYHAQWKHEIPVGWRITGENMFAEHSIRYEHLDNYFYVFGIWDETNTALSWDDTKQYATILGLTLVPEIYRGVWDKDLVHKAYLDYCETSKDPVEGYVIRVTEKILYRNYRTCTAKWVRKNHVQTDQHWMTKKVIPNRLRK